MGRFDHIGSEAEARPAVQPRYGFQHFVDLAEEAMGRGGFERALRYYGRALEQDRVRAEAWAGQARALLAMDQPEEAFTWLEQAVQVAGEQADFHALRAIAAARLGRAEEAMAWADKAMRSGADRAEIWLGRAEVLYQQGQGHAAGRCLDKAHEREPGGESARRCGEVALGAGDLPRAHGWLERARTACPDCPLVALRLGVYWERAGHLGRARTELHRALALEPGLAPARLALEDLGGRGVLHRVFAIWRRWNHGR
jgi:protein O-GlcNAc transferase